MIRGVENNVIDGLFTNDDDEHLNGQGTHLASRRRVLVEEMTRI
jgi:hypothetical protein